MTAPNPTAVTDMTVPVATLGAHGALALGFRQHWVEASADGVEAELASGAGLGSSYLTLSVSRPGKDTIYETVDVRDFLPGWINAAIARADAAAEPAETAARIEATGGVTP
jgi:hypothetical protein